MDREGKLVGIQTTFLMEQKWHQKLGEERKWKVENEKIHEIGGEIFGWRRMKKKKDGQSVDVAVRKSDVEDE